MIQTIIPKDKDHWLELRSKVLTSTEISALFGISPYTTEFETWHKKKNRSILQIDENERMTWGLRLEEAIAKGVATDQGWQLRRMNEFMYDDALRIGASFDYAIEHDGIRSAIPPESGGILEIKNVDSLQFKKTWLVEGDYIEAPPHIEIQIQMQLLVSGRAYAWLMALVGGNKQILIRRDRQQDVIDGILTKCAAFWASIDSNKPPEPNFTRDATFLSKLYGYAEPGKVMDGSEDADLGALIAKHRRYGKVERRAKKEKDIIKAKVLAKIGDAEKVLGDGWTLSTVTVGPAHIAYDRKGYRMFKPAYTTKEE